MIGRHDAGMVNSTPPDVLPLNRAARILNVPRPWLHDEVAAGRLPGLIAGRRILVHVPTVAAILAERAKGVNGDK
jgi:hypothetical protein